ncbi:MAG: hypothetical protein WC855_13550 [Thermodesulfovibrionales bacterium]
MSIENSKVYYKSVYFDLPFLIFVKDGFKDKTLEEWAQAYQKGEKLPYSPYAPCVNKTNSFTIGGGFPVYLPPEDVTSAYVVKVGDFYMGVQFLRRISQNNPANLCGEIVGDRTGRASFSSVRVNFDLRIFKSNLYMNTKYFVKLSIEGVNKFIEHYRVLTGKFYIRPITPAIIQGFTIFNSMIDGSTFTQQYVTDKSVIDVDETKTDNLPPSTYHMDAMLHGMGGAIDDQIDTTLRSTLNQDIEPSIIETLHLEVKDKLDLREWRLAVIESAVLFETYLNSEMRKVYKEQGLSGSDIEDKFHKNDRYRTPLSSYVIASSIVQDATGFDFKSTSEFQAWSVHTKDLRNDVVHGKKYKVSQEEAVLSYTSVLNAIRLIESNME